MMRRQLVAAGFGAYAIALVVTAPAMLVDAGLERASDGRLRLAAAQGTLWTGAGQLEIHAGGGRSGVAMNIAWRLLPGSLLRGHLVCEVELDQSSRRFPVTISLARIELADADIILPAAVLGLAVPKLAPLRLTGDMRLHVARFAIGNGVAQGNATLQWRAAGSALTPVAPLGDYELRIDGEAAVLRTLQGPLQLDGQGSWANGGNPVFLATARILPEHQPQLAPLLRLIAVETGAGRFELKLN